MQARDRTWDKSDILIATYQNKHYADEMTAKLLKYYSDPEKPKRKSEQLCKYCYYVDTSRIGGAAMTTAKCAYCKTEMTFGNTCTDILCDTCAELNKLCKRCGAKMD